MLFNALHIPMFYMKTLKSLYCDLENYLEHPNFKILDKCPKNKTKLLRRQQIAKISSSLGVTFCPAIYGPKNVGKGEEVTIVKCSQVRFFTLPNRAIQGVPGMFMSVPKIFKNLKGVSGDS